LREAGLDGQAHLTPADSPRVVPPVYADDRRGWTGEYPDTPGEPIRVEAAAYRGRPVYFYVGPPDRGHRLTPPVEEFFGRGGRLRWYFLAASAILVAMLIATALLARRNLRTGRANPRGAGRLAAVYAAAYLLAWAVAARHATDVTGELALFAVAVGRAGLAAGLLALIYLAIEPAVRRRLPWQMIGWNRLLDGRWRDPLVGRDVLLGGAAAVAFLLLDDLRRLAESAAGAASPPPPMLINVLNRPLGLAPVAVANGLFLGLTGFCVYFLLGRVFRRDWPAAVAAALIMLAGPALEARGVVWVVVPFFAAMVGLFTLVLLRFGPLAICAMWFVRDLIGGAPVTLNVGAWYGHIGVAYMLVGGAVAVYGFVVSLGGRPLFAKGFLGDE
jgi:serine/threonine-protein kinase